MRIRGEAGFSLLSFAIILSVVLVALMYFTVGRSAETAKRMGQNMMLSYASDISIKLAQKIRYAYDVAKVTESTQPALCSSMGGAILPLSSSVHLCVVGTQICVDHPRGTGSVCVNSTSGTLVAKHQLHPLSWLIPEALAQASDAPAEPLVTDTSNILTMPPSSCAGGDNCRAQCGIDADCVSYRFCPLIGTCTADQMVWQTIALLK
jgi:hypothetical protein